jgi:hypothetical protein
MSRRRRKDIGAGHRREEGPFLPIPMAFLASDVYRRLSRPAKVLLLDIGAQYSFSDPNNGQLIATMNKLRAHGWRSEVTLLKARRELENARVIVETRKGGFPNRATWYALTFFSLDPHKDYDIRATSYVRGEWRIANGLELGKKGRLLQKMAPRNPDSTIFDRPAVGSEGGMATRSEAMNHSLVAARASDCVVVSRSSHLVAPSAPSPRSAFKESC